MALLMRGRCLGCPRRDDAITAVACAKCSLLTNNRAHVRTFGVCFCGSANPSFPALWWLAGQCALIPLWKIVQRHQHICDTMRTRALKYWFYRLSVSMLTHCLPQSECSADYHLANCSMHRSECIAFPHLDAAQWLVAKNVWKLCTIWFAVTAALFAIYLTFLSAAWDWMECNFVRQVLETK